MLEIIMGTDVADNYLPDGKKLEGYTIEYFNHNVEYLYNPSWLESELVKEIIKNIDKALVLKGLALESLITGQALSARDISSGSKLLISVYNKPEQVLRMTMGNNCTDYLEKIATIHHNNGQDILLVSDYLHTFNFKYTDAIKYVNWNIVCHSWEDTIAYVVPKWNEQVKIYKQEQLRKFNSKHNI